MKTKTGQCDESKSGIIYALSHPVTGEVRYIGQTTKSATFRLQTHVSSSKCPSSNESKTPVGKWILKLHKNNLMPTATMLQKVGLSQLDAAEIAWICDGRLKHRLLNVANGGRVEGRKKGSKQSKEFCENQSKNRSGVKNQNFKDLSGKRFNKLVVTELAYFKYGSAWWQCQCDCGGHKIVQTKKLKIILSCGCARRTRKLTEKQVNALRLFGASYRYHKAHEDVT